LQSRGSPPHPQPRSRTPCATRARARPDDCLSFTVAARRQNRCGSTSRKAEAASVLRTMRHRPLAGVLDRLARRLPGAEALNRRQRLHPLPPRGEGGISRIHRLAFLGQTEGEGARQQEEIRERQLLAENIPSAL